MPNIDIDLMEDDVVDLDVPGNTAIIEKAEWGYIVGNIQAQEDLQALFQLKANDDEVVHKNDSFIIDCGSSVL